MPIVQNNPYPDVPDYFGAYHNWEQVKLPSGEIVYVVPGHPERVFVPSLSNASGRVVLRPNPAHEIRKQEEEEERLRKQQEQQEFNQSPEGQILPVAAGTAGTIAGALAINNWGRGPATAVNMDPRTGNVLMSDGSVRTFGGQTVQASPQAQAAAQGASAPAVQSGGRLEAPSVVGVERVTAVGTAPMPDGSQGTLMSDGTVVSDAGVAVQPDGTTVNLAPYLQGAAGALALASAYQRYREGDEVGAGISAAQGTANVAASLGSSTGASVAPWLAAANAAYGGYNTLNNDAMTGDEKATRLQQQAALGVADFYTFGGASALEGLARKNKTTGKWLRKLDKLDQQTNPVTMILGSVLGGPSTREIAKQHTSQLLEEGKEDPVYQAYVQGMREQYNSDPVDPTKPFAGKYGSWDEYVAGGLEAADLTGVYGNIKTYGPAWAGLTPAQRQAVTQANIDSGLYYSKKGEVEIRDEGKARENFNNVMKGFEVGAQAAPQPTPPMVNTAPRGSQNLGRPGPAIAVPATPAAAAAQGAMRSSTRSPGIGLDGRRLRY